MFSRFFSARENFSLIQISCNGYSTTEIAFMAYVNFMKISTFSLKILLRSQIPKLLRHGNSKKTIRLVITYVDDTLRNVTNFFFFVFSTLCKVNYQVSKFLPAWLTITNYHLKNTIFLSTHQNDFSSNFIYPFSLWMKWISK